MQWTFGNVTGNTPKIALPHTLVGAPSSYNCQHVLSAVSNVVLEVAVCGPNITDQASQIADAMAANVPK
jgi:serine/threonine-protein kinase